MKQTPAVPAKPKWFKVTSKAFGELFAKWETQIQVVYLNVDWLFWPNTIWPNTTGSCQCFHMLLSVAQNEYFNKKEHMYHHCWSVVNVFRMRMCALYSPQGVYQEILSLGQYFPIHSLGSRKCIVSVLHQNEGGIGKSIRDGQEISWDPRDFLREISRVEGNLEGGRDRFAILSSLSGKYWF